MKTAFLLQVLLLLGSLCTLQASHILCLVSTAKHNNPGWSQPLFDALLARGHHLTVISTEPNPNPKKEVEGLAYYHLPNEYDVMQKHFIDNETGEYKPMVPLKQLLVWYEVLLGSCHAVRESDSMQRLLPEITAQIFHQHDLIITDVTQGADCLLELVRTDNAPVLGLSASKLTPDLINLLHAENSISATRTPHHLSQVPRNMGFWNRVHNHILYLEEPIINWLVIRRVLEKMVSSERIFPNLQVVLLNTHPVVDYVQNLPPGVIEVGGLHIKDEVKRLPTYIQKFTEKFIDGIVYINMPYIESVRGLGIEAMAWMIQNNPKCGFIWNVKELALLPAEMPNLLTLHVDQALQEDILAQAVVKAFLNHGDSFSIQEAVYYAKPMVVLPLLLEQFNNAQRVKERYLGVVVQANEFHKESLSEALHHIVNQYNQHYFNKMHQAQQKFRSRPQSAVELAVWHVEQMLADPLFFDHLPQSKVNDQNFFLAYSLDALAAPLIFVLFVLFNLMHLIFGPKNPKKKPKKSKKVIAIPEPENMTLLEECTDIMKDLNEEVIEGEIELLREQQLLSPKKGDPIQKETIQDKKTLQEKKKD